MIKLNNTRTLLGRQVYFKEPEKSFYVEGANNLLIPDDNLTPGKLYNVVATTNTITFYIEDDNGDQINCLIGPFCAFIGEGACWKLVPLATKKESL